MKKLLSIILSATMFLAPVPFGLADSPDILSAAKRGDAKTVQELIDQGADFNVKDKGGNTPLILACEQGAEKAAEALIKAGARVNAWNDSRITPLIATTWAANAPFQFNRSRIFNSDSWDNRNPDARNRLVMLLLKNGATLAPNGPSETTPLMGASALGLEEAVQALLEFGSDPNETTESGLTALSFAAGNGWTSVVKTLLLAGASPDMRDSRGNTPLMMAAINGKIDAAVAMLQAGAGFTEEAIEKAKENDHEEVANMIAEYKEKQSKQEWVQESDDRESEALYSKSELSKDGVAGSSGAMESLYSQFKAIVIGMRTHERDPVKKEQWRGMFLFCVCREDQTKFIYKYKVDWNWPKNTRQRLSNKVSEMAKSHCGGCVKSPAVKVERGR